MGDGNSAHGHKSTGNCSAKWRTTESSSIVAEMKIILHEKSARVQHHLTHGLTLMQGHLASVLLERPHVSDFYCIGTYQHLLQ